jgi:nicotinamidase-related amidase
MSVPNTNTLRPDNAAFCFIDHQPLVQFPVQSIDNQLLISNVTCLAGIAKALDIPTVLTTIGARNSILADPLFSSLTDVFPDTEPIDRTTTNAWSDDAFRAAVHATGRRKLVMSGLWTEVCVAQTALAAMADGFEVFFVSDCSGGLSTEAHEDAKRRMTQAGAIPMTWGAVMSELAPDFTSPEYNAILAPVLAHGGGVALNGQYISAQITSGTVQLPTGA